MEVGFRLGGRQHRLHPEAVKAARNDVTLASMLALLGLMLAFTYSFSMSRADMRKQALVVEVNVISTAFLRADLASEPSRTELRELLFDYARSRVTVLGTIKTREQVQEVVDRSLEIQSKIWPATKLALRQERDMSDPERALLVSAINDVLDVHNSRMAVFYDRLPTAVLALLVLIAAASLTVAAYNTSMTGQSSRWRMSAFAVILAFVDVHHPGFRHVHAGLRPSQSPKPSLTNSGDGSCVKALIEAVLGSFSFVNSNCRLKRKQYRGFR